MSKFKIGDIVVANKFADDCYSFTTSGWIGKVIQIYDSSKAYDADIQVEGLYGPYKGPYDVSSSRFDLKTPADTSNEKSLSKEKKMLLKMYNKGFEMDTRIKKVIFNKPATIVLWDDGTKTVVKCQKGKNGKYEKYDKEKGLAMCIAKKALGNKSNFNNLINALTTIEDKK